MVQSEQATIHHVLNNFSRNTLIPIITELMMHFGATEWRRRGGYGMLNQEVGEYNVLTDSSGSRASSYILIVLLTLAFCVLASSECALFTTSSMLALFMESVLVVLSPFSKLSA